MSSEGTADETDVLKLRLRGVYKAFDATTVLDGIDLDVATGNVIALIGASGSGKSTLLRLSEPSVPQGVQRGRTCTGPPIWEG